VQDVALLLEALLGELDAARNFEMAQALLARVLVVSRPVFLWSVVLYVAVICPLSLAPLNARDLNLTSPSCAAWQTAAFELQVRVSGVAREACCAVDMRRCWRSWMLRATLRWHRHCWRTCWW
jgi:hypothetical protein